MFGQTCGVQKPVPETEHKSCCKYDTFGRGIFVRVSTVALFGREEAEDLGFLTVIAV